MDVLNRLKSAVTTVLPVGNPISGEYEILSQKGSGGPGMLWKVFDGVQRSTKQEVSVFILEKKQLDRLTRRDRDVVLEALKKGVSQLTRLRHPKILSVLHPLEDSRESLAFATEPVFCSVANVLGQHENLPQSALALFKDFKLFDVEIKYGLLQVVEALTFLHSNVHMIHSNVCPESIFINALGCWKIAGFDFCVPNSNPQSQSPLYVGQEWDPQLSPIAQPKLNFMAPEFVLTATCDTSIDMFSVGVLIFTLYNNGQPVLDSMNDWSKFKANVSKLKVLNISSLGDVPSEAREHVKMLLNTEAPVRPDADQLSKIPFFEDVGVMTLQYLDLLVQKDNLQKSQFFKGLPKVIDKLPTRVNIQRVFPSLCKECITHNMIPFVLPSMMVIAEMASDTEYAKIIFPAFIPLFKIVEPLQVVLIFLQNMNLLLSKTTPVDIRNHVLPMVARALEANQLQIQELCLSIIPSFASLVEYASLKNLIIPRIRKMCLSASTLSLRVNCLVCLGKILEYLDRWYVIDEVLPILQEIPSREPAVLMSMLGIYKIALTHKKLGITKEMLASKIVPFLFPICIDNGLNLTQFNAFISLVKDMISRVESEQRTKLEQLSSVQEEQHKLQQFAQEAVQGNKVSNGDASNSENAMESFMSGLGFGSFTSSNSSLSGGSKVSTGSPLRKSDGGARSATAVNDSKPGNRSQSLTMEEKAKLAQEQEMTHRFKSQPPLQLQSELPSANLTSKPSLRDLTSTLSSNSGFPVPPRSASSNSVPLSFPGGIVGGGVPQATGISWGSDSSFNTKSQGFDPQLVESSKKAVDLSSFDGLLTMGPKPRPSLNGASVTSQALRSTATNPFGASVGLAQFPPPGATTTSSVSSAFGSSTYGVMNPSTAVRTGMMPSAATSMGSGPMFGGPNMGSTQSGGVPLIRAPMNNSFRSPSQNSGVTQLSNKDIADLLG